MIKISFLLFSLAYCVGSFSAASLAQYDFTPMSFKTYKQLVSNIDINKHRISWTKFIELYNQPNVYILDLQDKADYDQGHIKGALHLGSNITKEGIETLIPDKTATILIYCSRTFQPTRMIALTHIGLPQIIALGFPNTYLLEEQWQTPNFKFEEFKKVPLWISK